MKISRFRAIRLAIGLLVGPARSPAVVLEPPAPQAATGAALAWPEMTPATRPGTRWWWHGSAVDKVNLAHVLEAYRAAGLGGVEITCIYGVQGEQRRDIPYLSDRWLDMVAHARGTTPRTRARFASRLRLADRRAERSTGGGKCGRRLGKRENCARIALQEEVS
jgi:hypothetical protein